MPTTLASDHEFKTIAIQQLHPTLPFGAEVTDGIPTMRILPSNSLKVFERLWPRSQTPLPSLHPPSTHPTSPTTPPSSPPPPPKATPTKATPSPSSTQNSTFNPRRASYSLLRAVQLPPQEAETGGNTEFADSRAAWNDLFRNLKARLLKNDYIGAFSHAHSRKLASPTFFRDVNPRTAAPMAKHQIVQMHEPTVLHRAGEWTGEWKYVRDLRRTTVHDDGSNAWGLNPVAAAIPSREGIRV
ncbi:alpha-ketoglutarate-dependent 2,4-dichlorophenoxyacetate dioxygenase [Naviculisporaceae sp. PSN 640]